jgi:hypothetical protein
VVPFWYSLQAFGQVKALKAGACKASHVGSIPTAASIREPLVLSHKRLDTGGFCVFKLLLG